MATCCSLMVHKMAKEIADLVTLVVEKNFTFIECSVISIHLYSVNLFVF